MALFARYAAGALMIGAFLFGGGTQQARAAACLTNTTLGALEALGATGCTQDDKTWFNFASTAGGGEIALPGATVVQFALITIGGIAEHTVTVSDPFTQGATYNLAYSVAITNPASGFDFSAVTGGLLLAAPGGNATLTKSFTTVGGGSVAGLKACANPATCPQSVTSPVVGEVDQINTTDAFFVDTSNVTGFSNTFEQKSDIPEPATMLLLGSGLLGIGLVRRRWNH